MTLKPDKKELKNLLDILKRHKKDTEAMYEVCKAYKIPYLTPAYRNVVDVMEQLIEDLEKIEVK